MSSLPYFTVIARHNAQRAERDSVLPIPSVCPSGIVIVSK